MDTRGLDSNDGDAFRFAFVIRAEIARAERDRMRDRVRSARARMIEQRRFVGGTVPYGYRSVPLDDGGHTLEIDPDEARWVRAAADMVLEGKSIWAVVKALNAAGSRPRRGRAWSYNSVKTMLRGDAILGRVRRNGQPIRGEDGLPLQVFPAIIPLSDAQRLRARLNQRSRRSGVPVRHNSRLLSGLLVCHSCGSTLRVSRTGQPHPKTVYACHGRMDGAGCLRSTTIMVDLVEDYITGEFLRAVGHLPWMEIREHVPDADLTEIEQAIRETTTELAASDADDGALFARLRALKQRRAEVLARPQDPVFKTVHTGETYASRWEAADTAGRRAMLAQDLDGPIIVGPGKKGRRGPHGFDTSRLAFRWTWED